MDYTFTIRFDNDTHSLSATNGLPIDMVGNLLISLNKAVGMKKDRLTLSGIKGNCYALDLTTKSELLYKSAEALHGKIAENDFSGLNLDQKKYAQGLHAIARAGYLVRVYDESKSFNYKIVDMPLENKVESYFEIDDVYGVIASIGGASLDARSAIKLSKEGYEIHVTREQEKKLIRHFKKDRLLLTIKKEISIETGKIESVSLINFEVMKGEETFFEKAHKLMKQHEKRGLFPKVKDTVSAVRRLRGDARLSQQGTHEG
jgi:hypothetical protein